MSGARPKTMKMGRTGEGEALAEPCPIVIATLSPSLAPRERRPPTRPDEGIFEGAHGNSVTLW